MRLLLSVFYYLLLAVAILLALLWLFDRTSLVGLEKGPELRFAIIVMAIGGMVMGRIIRRLKAQ